MTFSLAFETKSFQQVVLSFSGREFRDSGGWVRGSRNRALGSLEEVWTVLFLVSGSSASETEFFFDAAQSLVRG